MVEYDFFSGDIGKNFERLNHERNRLNHISLTDDESSLVSDIRKERDLIKITIDNVHAIEEHLVLMLSKLHIKKSALLHRIKERECLRIIEIDVDCDGKIVEVVK